MLSGFFYNTRASLFELAQVYIVAIAWLYIAILMAVTETSFIAGLATFLFYGLGPLLLFWWIVGTRVRKQRRLMRMSRKIPDQPDQPDTRGDQ